MTPESPRHTEDSPAWYATREANNYGHASLHREAAQAHREAGNEEQAVEHEKAAKKQERIDKQQVSGIGPPPSKSGAYTPHRKKGRMT